MLTLKFFFCC